MLRKPIRYFLISFTFLLFQLVGIGSNLILPNLSGWFIVADYSHLRDAVVFIEKKGSIILFLIENGYIYDFIVKDESSLLVSTENEVFELKYLKEETNLSKTTLINFPQGMYCKISIIGEINDGIWLICTPVHKPFDIQQELVFVKDHTIINKISMEYLLGIDNKAINNAIEKGEGYTVKSDRLGDTIYFIISPILFSEDKKVKCYMLDKIKNEWKLFFERETKVISPLIIYEGKIRDLGEGSTFDIPSYVNASFTSSMRKWWIKENEGAYVFLEERFDGGYYAVKQEIKQKTVDKIKLLRKYNCLFQDPNGIYVYCLSELSKLKLEFRF
jgi:hypothetical protein